MDLVYISRQPAMALIEAFQQAGYRVVTASPAKAETTLVAVQAEYILLDLPRPDTSLLEHCLALRATSTLLVLTAASDRAQRIAILRAGADVCLPQPVAAAELVARVQALSRRYPHPAASGVAPPLWLCPGRLLLGRGRRQQPLTVSEQRLLALLAREGSASRQRIEAQVWGDTGPARTALIERHVCNLRRKLAQLDAPNALRTLRGFGYSLGESVQVRTV